MCNERTRAQFTFVSDLVTSQGFQASLRQAAAQLLAFHQQALLELVDMTKGLINPASTFISKLSPLRRLIKHLLWKPLQQLRRNFDIEYQMDAILPATVGQTVWKGIVQKVQPSFFPMTILVTDLPMHVRIGDDRDMEARQLMVEPKEVPVMVPIDSPASL